jgi:hypothetical protein
VEVREARSGFSISWPGDLVVTLHRHPGTAMFHDDPILVRVEKGGIRISELPATDDGTFALPSGCRFRPPAIR